MGASYDAMNCKDEAILSYNKSININKNICETYFNVANIYLKKLDYNQAIKNYKKAIFLNKNYSTAYNNLGIAYIEKKDLINAQKVLEDLVNINPNYSQGICNLATVFLQKDDHEKALSYYELAMTCNNSPKEKIEIQKNLSLCQLKMENFKEGWKNYKSRVHSDGYISISNLPLFKLNSSFKNVIILPEQGIGDEIFLQIF